MGKKIDKLKEYKRLKVNGILICLGMAIFFGAALYVLLNPFIMIMDIIKGQYMLDKLADFQMILITGGYVLIPFILIEQALKMKKAGIKNMKEMEKYEDGN